MNLATNLLWDDQGNVNVSVAVGLVAVSLTPLYFALGGSSSPRLVNIEEFSEERKKLIANRAKSVAAIPNPTNYQRLVGMFAATIFSSIYIVAPIWLFVSLYLLVFHTFEVWAWVIVAPVVVSAMIPPIPAKYFLSKWPFCYLSAYFDYEEVMEVSPEDLQKLMEKRNVLFCVQPHGVFSFGGACAGVEWSKRWWDPVECPTAVASVLTRTPLLKHVLGIFGMVDASSKTLTKQLSHGHAVLYIGGIAELFLSSPTEEKLFIKKRKGFIKLALRSGADIFPIYFFGNTEALEVARGYWVRKFARVTGMSLTPMIGRWYTIIPNPTKIVGVLGKPLGLPKIENPTQEDVDKYHAQYVSEVERIYETYKDLSPSYTHKELTFED